MKTFYLHSFFYLVFLIVIPFAVFSKEGEGVAFKKLSGQAGGKEIHNLINGILHDNKSSWSPPILFPTKVKENSPYESAWKKSVSYFPDRYVYINNSKELMMHGPYNGKNCIEIYNSQFLQNALNNQNMFTGNTVKKYKEISGDPAKKAAFDEKLGLLSGYFENEKSLEKLKQYLKTDKEKKGKTCKLFDEMMSALANEGKQMLAGALLHEGTHATLTDLQTFNIQQDFANGYLSMELNELRSFMVEIIYHCQFYNWAKQDISNQWGDIALLLADLEKCRRQKPPDLTQEEQEKIEEIKAKIKAHIAIIRVHLRETTDSAKRMKDLADIYQDKYTKDVDPKKDKIKPESRLKENFRDLVISVTNFNTQVGQLVKDMNSALQELEDILKEWNEYALCHIPGPPPPGPTDSLVTANQKKQFPDPPIATAEELKKAAEKEIDRNYSIAGGGEFTTTPSNFSRISLAGGVGYSSIDMHDLNEYFSYLNRTWNGNLQTINSGFGFSANLDYHLTKNFSAGLGFEQMNTSTEGVLKAYNSDYKSENSISGLSGRLTLKSNPILGNLTFIGSVEAGEYFALYKESEEDYITEGNGKNFGFRISAGAEYLIVPHLGLQVQSGYRSLNIANIDAEFFLPGNPPPSVKLDYSGFFGEIKVAVYF